MTADMLILFIYLFHFHKQNNSFCTLTNVDKKGHQDRNQKLTKPESRPEIPSSSADDKADKGDKENDKDKDDDGDKVRFIFVYLTL